MRGHADDRAAPPAAANALPTDAAPPDSDVAVARGSFALISDLDGTLLPAPCADAEGKTSHPPITDGPAYAPLVELLHAGAIVVGVTGSRFETHRRRFFDPLPLELRRSGRVLLACESGARLFRACRETGEPVEDLAFQASAFGGRRPRLEPDVVEALCAFGRRGLRRFYADFLTDPDLLARAAGAPISEHVREVVRKAARAGASADAPISLDADQVPRIEVRGEGAAVVFVGVPSPLGNAYFDLAGLDATPAGAGLAALVDARPTGRLCFDILPEGVGKKAVVRFLLECGTVAPGRALCLGDRPMGNDEGLAAWALPCAWAELPALAAVVAGALGRAGDTLVGPVPFISVAENAELVPQHLHAYSAGGNVRGSAALLDHLLRWLVLQPAGDALATPGRTFGGREARALAAQASVSEPAVPVGVV